MAKDQINKSDYNKSKIDKPITEDPKALENQKKSILAAPAGPSSEERGGFVKWEKLSELVGQPFDTELIPFSKLRQMRNDPMIGFGLYYKKAPLIRAKWKINARDKNGPNAQIAAFVDSAFRPIYASTIEKYLLSHDFGFSAMEKQFKFENPGATYIDPKDPTSEKLVWTDSKIPPIVFKEFVSMPPEKVKPKWDKKTGEFIGIDFESENAKKKSSGGDKPTIDIYHALWATHNKNKTFGSLWGYPAIAHAYHYWWTYWYRWHMANRAFERQAVPPIKMRYPEGRYVDPDTDEEYENVDIAVLAGNKIRSNGVIALPSSTNNAGMDKISNLHQWDAEFMKGGEASVDFINMFKYLDTMKLRSLFIPEQALIEGDVGGSRNVAGTMNENFQQAMYNEKMEIDLFINKYILPQLVARNFPDFVANGGTVELVTTGFDSTDTQYTKEIIQLIGQSDPTKLDIVDLRAALTNAGLPMKSVDDLTAEAESGALTTTPDAVEPVPGQLGIVPSEGTATGFSYIQPREVITVNLADDEYFEEKAPEVPYFDKEGSKYLKQAYAKLKKRYSNQYGSLSKYIAGATALSTEEVLAGKAQERAEQVVNRWAEAQGEDDDSFLATVAGLIAIYLLFNKGKNAELSDQELNKLKNEYVSTLRNQIDNTTKDELTKFIASRLEQKKSFKDISVEISDHFADFPTWKAMRVIRTEARNLYNQSVLKRGKEAGIEKYLIHDALLGDTDEECEIRDGKVVEHKTAIELLGKLHSNCTFYLEAVNKANFSIEDVEPEFTEGAFFSDDDATLYISTKLTEEERISVIKQAVSAINER